MRKTYTVLVEFTNLGKKFNRDEVEYFVYGKIEGYGIENLNVTEGRFVRDWISYLPACMVGALAAILSYFGII